MADTKISGLTALTGANTASGDLLTIVDVSDTTMAATGTNKKITLTELQSAPVSAGTANGVLYLNGSKVATAGSALTFDGTTLNFGSAGSRITGDMSNATQLNRLLFQNSVANSNTSIGVMPNGTATSARVNVFNSSAPDNAAYCQMAVDAGTAYIQSATTGTGTALPLSFITGGSTRFSITTAGESVWSIGSELMRLTSTGLGIGTSSPAYKLDVAGAARSDSWIGRSNTSAPASTDAFIYRPADNTLGFGTASSEKMRLDSSGNLGLGVTPSAWRSGAKAFQLGTTGYASLNEQANGSTSLNFNCYESAANTWTYFVTGVAPTRYTQLSGAHAWFTAASGTAGNAITFTQAMTLDASGNLGIGTTTPDVFGRGYGRVIGVSSASSASVEVNAATGNAAFVDLGVNGVRYLQVYADSSAPGLFTVGSIPLAFGTNGAERARIDSSGNLLVGQTARGHQNSNSFDFDVSNALGYVNHISGTASSTSYFSFGYNGASIGSITQSGTTAVLYNVTSDQRLKENIVDAPEFGSVIDAIQVRSYDWKADGNHQRAGFVAQELVTVAPEAVHQPADPEEMMAVDYSKLVPMLVKEIQSLRVRVAQLESN